MQSNNDEIEPLTQLTESAFSKTDLGQQLIALIQQGSGSQKKIADYLLRHQLAAATLGIGQLAKACHVSNATISRFARDLGLDGFADLRNAFALALQEVLNPVDKLKLRIRKKTDKSAPVLRSLESAMLNTASTFSELDTQTFNHIIRNINRAKRIYVMGYGFSSLLASTLVQHLKPFCKQVIEVVGMGGSEVAMGNIVDANKHDLLISISFPRYTTDGVQLTQFMQTQGAKIIAITDSFASPLIEFADHVLLAKSNHPILPSSQVSAICIIEAIAIAVMASNKNNVQKAIRLTAAITSFMHLKK